MAFDHTSYGDSEGLPRFDEDRYAKSEDIKNAVTFLVGREEVDRERIGAVGVCGGGGYVPYAAVADRRIKAVATVSGLPDLRATITSGYAGDWRQTMGAAATAREAYAQGAEPRYVPFMPTATAVSGSTTARSSTSHPRPRTGTGTGTRWRLPGFRRTADGAGRRGRPFDDPD
ncbi:hypothetical protein [Streptomyces malaysiensis]|uniref:hypothetical protein n=1 Tax=Streptomyces malaysiensis TaxID=92644 RepID=UPI0035578A81